MRVPGGGASCLGLGRPGTGALPPPTSRPFGRAAGAHYPLAVGAGGAGVGTRHQPHSARSCCCGEGMRVPGGGASCLGSGRPGSRALPPPTTRPFGRAAGAHYPLAVGAGGVGVGTRHQPRSGRSCELALRAVGATRGRLGGRLLPGCAASGDGRSPTPDHPSFRACGRGPLPTYHRCGVRAWGPGYLWHLVPCRRSSCVVRASRVRGIRWPLWLGICPRAVVVAGGVPLWRASWPRVGAPLLVRSGRSRCSGQLFRLRGAFPHPWGCRPRLYWVAARGTWRPAENRAHCACCWPLPRERRWACSASYPLGAPRWGCPWRVPAASVLGCVRCGGLACVDPITDASGFPYRLSCDRGLGWCTGAVSCGRRHRPFRVGGRNARVPPVCACACFAWPGRAGRPPGRVLVRLTFLLAVFGALFACSAPSGLGLPRLWLLLRAVFFLLSLSPPSLRPRCVLLCVFSGPGCLGPWRLVPPPPPPPPFFCLPTRVVSPLSPALRDFLPQVPWALASCPPPLPPPLFFCLPPPVVSGVSCFPVALDLCAPPPPLFLCRLCGPGRVCLSWAVGCARVCLGGAVPVVALCALAGVVWCWLLGLPVLCCLLVGLGVVLWWCCPCLAAWLAALLFGLVCLGVPLPCIVFCRAVMSCDGVLSCSAVCLRRCLCLLFVSCRCVSAVCDLGCRAVCSLSSPPCAVLCCAVLVPLRCAVRVVCAVSGGWCCWFLVSLPFVVGLLVALVARRCRLVVCVGFGARVWSGRRSASSLWCPAPLCCVLWRCSAVWCCAVVPCPPFFCFSPCWWRWFPVVPRWFWAPGRFQVVSVSVLCLCGAVLVCLRRCSLFGALLPSRGWLVFCFVACCVCVFAVGPGCPLSSPGGSWWLLVSCLGGVLWCVPGCCAAPCCCALCCLALRCCALCCFIMLRLVLPRAVLCPGALSVILGFCAFWRRVLYCPPVLCVFCCGVSLRGVVRRCALCRVPPGVSCCAFPVVSALCGVAVWPAPPRCPAPLCSAPWCCAAAWCRGVLSTSLVWFVPCVGVFVPT